MSVAITMTCDRCGAQHTATTHKWDYFASIGWFTTNDETMHFCSCSCFVAEAFDKNGLYLPSIIQTTEEK